MLKGIYPLSSDRVWTYADRVEATAALLVIIAFGLVAVGEPVWRIVKTISMIEEDYHGRDDAADYHSYSDRSWRGRLVWPRTLVLGHSSDGRASNGENPRGLTRDREPWQDLARAAEIMPRDFLGSYAFPAAEEAGCLWRPST